LKFYENFEFLRNIWNFEIKKKIEFEFFYFTILKFFENFEIL
jgi:hypothetical protein